MFEQVVSILFPVFALASAGFAMMGSLAQARFQTDQSH